MKRVVVGLSGGVDSSVAAWLLKEQGYEVIGIYMRNWHDDSVTINNECPWIDDSNDAMLVAEHLDIPFQVLDLSEDYKNRIVDYMFAEYESGKTPNPDVLCNREIKFDVFLKAALELGADYVATGHYCQKREPSEAIPYHGLISGADNNKDQSYFLCQVSQEQLAHILFPIGHLEKPKVREIANEIGLPTANKKDSQGLCFVGKISLPDFLQQQLKPKKGKVIRIDPEATIYAERSTAIESAANEIDQLKLAAQGFTYTPEMGVEVGDHNGAHFYTIGQRRGLGIGGYKLPLFVIGTDTQSNHIYVGEGEDHLGLNKSALRIHVNEINWIQPDKALKNGERSEVMARIRYRQALVPATLLNIENTLYLKFPEPMKGITPGQFAAWYLKGELIGSGVIES